MIILTSERDKKVRYITSKTSQELQESLNNQLSS